LISAGFSNGLAAVWDLTSNSQLLTFEKKGVSGVYPIRVVQSNHSCITAIKFHHSSNTRYLMTVGLDRKVKVYDLDSSFIPLEISSDLVRSRVLSADWNLNWTAFQLGLDESLSMGE
jgi:general transcription factor 3C polypeptide 2